MASLAHTMILHGGGLRSLVALAATLNRPERLRVTLVHVHDGRAAAAARLDHVHRQAQHYGLSRVDELHLPQLFGRPDAATPDGLPAATLAGPRLLIAAMAHAIDHRAAALLWPAAFDARPDALARGLQQKLLIGQLADAAALEPPTLTCPLIRFTDRQVVELGTSLDAPFELARSCALGNAQPCATCPACRRRYAAFRAARLADAAPAPGV